MHRPYRQGWITHLVSLVISESKDLEAMEVWKVSNPHQCFQHDSYAKYDTNKRGQIIKHRIRESKLTKIFLNHQNEWKWPKYKRGVSCVLSSIKGFNLFGQTETQFFTKHQSHGIKKRSHNPRHITILPQTATITEAIKNISYPEKSQVLPSIGIRK